MNDAHDAARRRYRYRCAIAVTAYVVSLPLIDYVVRDHAVRDHAVRGPAAALVVLLPALCVVSTFWAIGRLLLEQKDKYLRALQVRQLLIATSFALMVATVWGFLDIYGLAPHLSAFLVVPLFFGGLAIGWVLNDLKWRKRTQPMKIE